MRVTHLFGEDVLQGEAESGRQGADKPQTVEGHLRGGGQQHPSDDGDEGDVHLEGGGGGGRKEEAEGLAHGTSCCRRGSAVF